MCVTQTMAREIAALQRMTPKGLRTKYAEVFGEPTRSGNRQHLLKRIAWRLQSLEQGTLSERARRRAEEVARDADIRWPPPRDGQKPAVAGVVASGRIKPRHASDDRLPPPGTVLTRPYKGQMLTVTVLDEGFEHEGEAYRTLSAVAKAITGSHVNGYSFFGLGKPRGRGGNSDRTG